MGFSAIGDASLRHSRNKGPTIRPLLRVTVSHGGLSRFVVKISVASLMVFLFSGRILIHHSLLFVKISNIGNNEVKNINKCYISAPGWLIRLNLYLGSGVLFILFVGGGMWDSYRLRVGIWVMRFTLVTHFYFSKENPLY